MEILNRKAKFNYHILSEIEAGISLKGTEVKSIRNGSANIGNAYVYIKDDEAYISNMHIAKYEEGNRFNHEEERERKLLLHKREILSLKDSLNKDRLTIIPLKMYFKNNRVKLLIGLAKGKKLHDKRESIKERDLKRQNRYLN